MSERTMPPTTAEPHPDWGPCDGFGPDGACSECYTHAPTTAEQRSRMWGRLKPFDGERLIIHVEALQAERDAALDALRREGEEVQEGGGWHLRTCPSRDEWVHFQHRMPCSRDCAEARALLDSANANSLDLERQRRK